MKKRPLFRTSSFRSIPKQHFHRIAYTSGEIPTAIGLRCAFTDEPATCLEGIVRPRRVANWQKRLAPARDLARADQGCRRCRDSHTDSESFS